jgi:hypothetical protein
LIELRFDGIQSHLLSLAFQLTNHVLVGNLESRLDEAPDWEITFLFHKSLPMCFLNSRLR